MDWSSAVSRLLGYAILLGAFGLKVPQMLQIVQSGSVEGLSELAFYTEIPLSTTAVVYNYLRGNPFISYGETFIILVQNLILVGMLWTYSIPIPKVGTIIIVLCIFMGVAVCSFYLPYNLQVLNPPKTWSPTS